MSFHVMVDVAQNEWTEGASVLELNEEKKKLHEKNPRPSATERIFGSTTFKIIIIISPET